MTIIFLCLACPSFADTSDETSPENLRYLFWVLLYEPPVQPGPWTVDPKLAADPEGAALNIVKAMQRGDVREWLANWDRSQKPKLTRKQRQALVGQWHSLQDCQIEILGRVVDGFEIVVELSLISPNSYRYKIQVPLIKSNGRWWLTKMEPTRECLNWQSSTNKLMDHLDPDSFWKHLEAIEPTKQRASQ